MVAKIALLARGSSELFLDSFTVRYSRRTALLGLLIFLGTLSIFAVMSPEDALPNGDAALYMQQIENRDFTVRSIHLGYYWIGTLFTDLLPISADYSLGIMNAVFGALSITLIYFMAYSISRQHHGALMASLILLTNYMFVYNSVYAEMYISQAFFLLLALYLWLLRIPIWSGTAFAMSFLISPSTAFAIPCFIVIRPKLRPLFLFGVAASLISGFALWPHREEYLLGHRGVLTNLGRPFLFVEAVVKEAREIFYGLFAFIPAVIIGAMHVANEKRLRVLGIGIISLWLVSFVLGEPTGIVPIQLTTYILLALLGGVGTAGLFNRSATNFSARRLWLPVTISLLFLVVLTWVTSGTQAQISGALTLLFITAMVVWSLVMIGSARAAKGGVRRRLPLAMGAMVFFLCLNGLLTLQVANETRQGMMSYKASIADLNRVADPNYLVVGGFSAGILFEHYTFRSSYTGRWINTERLYGKGVWEDEDQVEAKAQWQTAIDEHREIWLLNDNSSIVSDLHQASYQIEPFGSIYRAVSP